VKQVLIFSTNRALIKSWLPILQLVYHVSKTDSVDSDLTADVIIIDSQKIEDNKNLLSVFNKELTRCLIVGQEWPEQNQIKALTQGAAGYCESSESPQLILQALEQVLKGDVWISRHLVPKVIGSLIKMKSAKPENTKPLPPNESIKRLSSLSAREMDVAKMIESGKNNKTIASTLHISERTVKAHLTSIFKKLDVPSRLHLAIFIKELS
jgi:DNA-binding NarL/FixJ family response regulator